MTLSPANLEQMSAGKAKWSAECRLRPSIAYRPGRLIDIWGNPIPEADNGQLQFHQAKHVIRSCAPGNGWGKSTVAAVEVDWWGHNDHPWPYEIPQHRPRQMVWIAQTYKQWNLLRKSIEPWWPPSVVQTWRGQPFFDYTWPDGSTLTVFTAETAWETVQGPSTIDLVLGDEEIPQKLAAEMMMRRRGNTTTRYIFNGTATQGITWMYHKVYLPWKKYHDDRGIHDEREMMRVQLHDEGDANAELVGTPGIWCWPKGGHYDNPEATLKTWANYQVTTGKMFAPVVQAVRLHGGYREFAGNPVFDPEALETLRAKLQKGESGWFVEVDEKECAA